MVDGHKWRKTGKIKRLCQPRTKYTYIKQMSDRRIRHMVHRNKRKAKKRWGGMIKKRREKKQYIFSPDVSLAFQTSRANVCVFACVQRCSVPGANQSQ